MVPIWYEIRREQRERGSPEGEDGVARDKGERPKREIYTREQERWAESKQDLHARISQTQTNRHRGQVPGGAFTGAEPLSRTENTGKEDRNAYTGEEIRGAEKNREDTPPEAKAFQESQREDAQIQEDAF